MKELQLDLFAKPDANNLTKEIEDVKESLNKIRKGQFGKIGKLEKICLDLSERLDIIERNICNPSNYTENKILEFALM